MSLNLEYNTQRGKLNISEYGRIVQKLIAAAVNEPDRDKRQNMANQIVQLMAQLNPQIREVTDYKHKLWDHLFIISNFQLDVDSPYPKPNPELINSKPERIDYPQTHIKFRFYGKNITKMIKTVAALEDGPVKTAYINAVGSFMKMSSRNWNDELLHDEEIMQHLAQLSDGKIILTTESEDVQFNTMNQQNGGRRFNNRNKNRNGNGNRFGNQKNKNFGNKNYKRW
ncbi:MAG: DUF4290 domain-containing protein [Bacteroidia bacterium]